MADSPLSAFVALTVFPVTSTGSLSFVNNHASLSGGAVHIESANDNIFFAPGAAFTGNTASGSSGSGGAVYIGDSNKYIYFYSASFVGNKATVSGGALTLSQLNTPVNLYSCTFRWNRAELRGAMYFRVANGKGLLAAVTSNAVQLHNATVIGNHASTDGGGLACDVLNAVSVMDSRFEDNTAGRNGGAIAATQSNINVSTTAFARNSAGAAGGAVAMNSNSGLNVQPAAAYTDAVTVFAHNSAVTEGGAIFLGASNTLSTYGPVVFDENMCTGSGGRGGAVSVNTLSTVTVGAAASLSSNGVRGYGGALSVTASALAFGPHNVSFVNNSAASGSALYLSSSSTSAVTLAPPASSTVGRIVFRDNVCHSQGGTVYWECDGMPANASTSSAGSTVLFGPSLAHYQRVLWGKNTAPLSSQVATQPIALSGGKQSSSSSSSSSATAVSVTVMAVQQYNAFLQPSPSFRLTDYFGSVNTTDHTTTATASVLKPYYCGGNSHIGYLSGVTTETALAGVVTFRNISVFCYPGGNMTLLYQAQPSGFDPSHTVTTRVTLVFRACRDGEVLVNNQCEDCPAGSYSLHYAPTGVCTPCPANTVDCKGSTIVVAPGYWRLSPYSTVMLSCPLPGSCAGGDGDGNGRRRLQAVAYSSAVQSFSPGCTQGHTGPLCAVCASSYYLDTTKQVGESY
jgi:predicted outer membrane repeat protein